MEEKEVSEIKNILVIIKKFAYNNYKNKSSSSS